MKSLVFIDVYPSDEWFHVFPLLPSDHTISSGSCHGLLIGSLPTEENTLQLLLGIRKGTLACKATVVFSIPRVSRTTEGFLVSAFHAGSFPQLRHNLC